MRRKTALTIAGSDCSGGAGIQADVKTMTVNGVYAMSVITAMTAQNTIGIRAVQESTSEFLKAQLDAVFEDIFPDAVKIGMVPSAALMHVISERLGYYRAQKVVIDPVMAASTGFALANEDSVRAMTDELLPISALVTPNVPEAQILSGIAIEKREDMIRAAEEIHRRFACSVLVKGGHIEGNADDLLFDGEEIRWFGGKRIVNPNTHGTGCTLSSAIAANLAKGYPMPAAVQKAKDYLAGSLSAMLDLGKGSGPLDHAFCLGEMEFSGSDFDPSV